MLGIDYSSHSVELARRIAKDWTAEASDSDADGHDDSTDVEPPSFRQWDIINGSFRDVLEDAGHSGGWDVVLDKGTFDAVSLSDDRDPGGRRINELYRDRVLRLVRPGGIFLITSCNWTEDELGAWFTCATDAVGAGRDVGVDEGVGRFIFDGRVVYKSFSFGGVKGQTISSLCFRKIT
jgi:hypothetical protein